MVRPIANGFFEQTRRLDAESAFGQLCCLIVGIPASSRRSSDHCCLSRAVLSTAATLKVFQSWGAQSNALQKFGEWEWLGWRSVRWLTNPIRASLGARGLAVQLHRLGRSKHQQPPAGPSLLWSPAWFGRSADTQRLSHGIAWRGQHSRIRGNPGTRPNTQH